MKKSKFLVATMILMLGMTFFGCTDPKFTDEEISKMLGTNELPSSYWHITYSIDITDYKLLIGDSDYVFVGEVKGYNKTIYLEDVPRTFYSIRVKENIKGELITDRDIEIKKAGGISKNHKSFTLPEGDFLPKIGETCIFVVYAQSSDGSILASGLNSSIKIENANDYKNKQNYLDVLDGYANEIISGRTRATSIYDVNYVG